MDYRDFNARFLGAQVMQIEKDRDKSWIKHGISYFGWKNKWIYGVYHNINLTDMQILDQYQHVNYIVNV